MRNIEVMGLGACLLWAPLGQLHAERRVANTWWRLGLSSSVSAYTLDEAIQAIRFVRGEFDIPRGLRALCALPDGPDEAASWSPTAPDLVLVEINSPVRIAYGPYSLCRATLNENLLNRLGKKSEEIYLAASRWYAFGLMEDNGEMRAETSEILLDALANEPDFPNAELARSILTETVPHRRDFEEIVAGLATLRALIDAPLAMVTYTHQYMPDGRPLPWPADFVEVQEAAAERLGLPVFRPSRIVRARGFATAMREDGIHYQEAFVPTLAEAMLAFIKETVDPTAAAGDGSMPGMTRGGPSVTAG
jgi:hypothetical protein